MRYLVIVSDLPYFVTWIILISLSIGSSTMDGDLPQRPRSSKSTFPDLEFPSSTLTYQQNEQTNKGNTNYKFKQAQIFKYLRSILTEEEKYDPEDTFQKLNSIIIGITTTLKSKITKMLRDIWPPLWQ